MSDRPASATPSRHIRRALVLGVGILAATLAAQAAAEDSLRCDGQLIQVGDPKARLVRHCGEPISKDVVEVVRSYDDGEQIRARYAEDWAYETAAVEGVRLLRFEGGRLVGAGMRCPRGLVEPGDSTVTVLQRCGEPLTRDSAGLVNERPVPASVSVASDSPVDQWVYSRGAGSLLKIVLLRGGTIESIQDGPRQ